MVDLITIIIKDLNPAILVANPLLIFEPRNISTEGFLFPVLDNNGKQAKDKNGKLLYKTPYKNAMFNGLEFIIYETGTIILSGSLHKYWNHGAHNYNDFSYSNFLWVLNDLKHKFNIRPEQCILKCLEIGINIVPPIPTNEILDNCFLHKTKPFVYQFNSDKGKYKQVQHSQYIIKIYNKALHYRKKGFEIEGEIMRFEIKYTKMQKINERGIYNLQDLINYGLQNFKDTVLNEWQNVLFYDNTTRIDPLSKKNKNILLEYSNIKYWTDLLENNQNENFKYHRKQLKKITFENSKNVQDLTAKIISKKIDFLNYNTTQIDPLTILSKRIVLNYENEIKNTLCKVTGLNISMQKNDSILLSHTGLKYYYKTDRKIFEQIKRRYLSNVWNNSDFEIQIKELAHNIRNADSNRNIKQKRIYKPQQINLLSMFSI